MEKKTTIGKILAALLMVAGICIIASVFVPRLQPLIGLFGVALIIIGILMNMEKRKRKS